MITNSTNRKRYVGKSLHPYRRWSAHKRLARNGDQRRLYRSMRKYGIENFEFDVIAWFDNEELAFLEEAKLVDEWRLCDPSLGYNLTTGGRGGFKTTDEVRARSKERMSGVKNPMYGKHHTDETKRILSELLSGANNANFGVPKSDDIKQKISEAQRGRKFTDDHREKLRKAKLGTKTGRNIPPEMAIARRKRVEQLLNNVIVATFCSLTEASKLTGFNGHAIMACCLGRKPSYQGYCWHYS